MPSSKPNRLLFICEKWSPRSVNVTTTSGNAGREGANNVLQDDHIHFQQQSTQQVHFVKQAWKHSALTCAKPCITRSRFVSGALACQPSGDLANTASHASTSSHQAPRPKPTLSLHEQIQAFIHCLLLKWLNLRVSTTSSSFSLLFDYV